MLSTFRLILPTSIIPLIGLLCGCSTPLSLDPAPSREQVQLAQRSVLSSDALSQWTVTVLQLEGLPSHPSPAAVEYLERLCRQRPDAAHFVALAEVAYALGRRDPSEVGESRLVIAALASWVALFREQDQFSRFGAEWELARALHNASVARFVTRISTLPGCAEAQVQLRVGSEPVRMDYRWEASAWSPEFFDRFFVADDFRVRGMRNRHRQSGVGGAILGERVMETATNVPASEAQLPPRFQAVTLTAVIREVEFAPDAAWPPRSLSLRVVDPARQPTISIAGRPVPVEADFTAALTHTLAGPRPVHAAGLGGLRDVARWEEFSGLYMLEPFDPQRIPVVFVHGLVSSPLAWREMVNDLWSDPLIRSRFQFWVFLYPTGQPFSLSASALRQALAATRRRVDPERRSEPFDQMVLVGHSMGGLLSRMLTVEPGTALWESVSDVPFEEIVVSEEDRAQLTELLFSPPVPEVSRVIFIAVPHRGSRIADGAFGRLGAGLVRLPPTIIEAALRVFEDNPDQVRFSQDSRWPVSTSIHSLSPTSPILLALADLPTAPGVTTHSIIGRRSGGAEPGGSDGVVPFESATLPGVDSELIIAGADHGVPMHPAAMVEVRRILLLHLDAVK
jgi:pimeloyl-ACP methyl ester carboxylesterase